jgi:hypothetical protein
MGSKGWKNFPFINNFVLKKIAPLHLPFQILCVLAPLRALRETKIFVSLRLRVKKIPAGD